MARCSYYDHELQHPCEEDAVPSVRRDGLCATHWRLRYTSGASISDDPVNPRHYADLGDYSAVHVVNRWQLGYNLGQTVKYIQRAGHKPSSPRIEDLRKARWYLDFEIAMHDNDNQNA